MDEEAGDVTVDPGRATISHPDEHYRRLVQEVRGCAIFSLDAQGRIISWNRGAELIHGHAADDILGQEFSRLFTDADARVGNPQRLLGTVSIQGSVSEEGWMVRSDNSRFWADISLTVL